MSQDVTKTASFTHTVDFLISLGRAESGPMLVSPPKEVEDGWIRDLRSANRDTSVNSSGHRHRALISGFYIL